MKTIVKERPTLGDLYLESRSPAPVYQTSHSNTLCLPSKKTKLTNIGEYCSQLPGSRRKTREVESLSVTKEDWFILFHLMNASAAEPTSRVRINVKDLDRGQRGKDWLIIILVVTLLISGYQNLLH